MTPAAVDQGSGGGFDGTTPGPTAYRWRVASYVWYLLPFSIAVLLIVVAPLGYALYLSLSRYNLAEPYLGIRFVGLTNYLRAITDPYVLSSIRISFVYVFFSLVGEIFIGLVLALAASRELPGTKGFRVLLLAPLLLTPAAVGMVWKFFYSYTGLVNFALGRLGLHPVQWFSVQNALTSIIIVSIWQNYPFSFLVILAGLRTIPATVVEAAQIDGAAPFKVFAQITLPLIRSFIIIILVIRTINILRYVDLIFTLTAGGPGRATETFSFLIYTNAFTFFDMGYGSALSFVLVVVSIGIMWFYLRLMVPE